MSSKNCFLKSFYSGFKLVAYMICYEIIKMLYKPKYEELRLYYKNMPY